MNADEIFKKYVGSSPVISITEPEEPVPTKAQEEPEKLDFTPKEESIFKKYTGFSPIPTQKKEGIPPPSTEPISERVEPSTIEEPEMTASERPVTPLTSTLEFTEPTEVKPSEYGEATVAPSPAPAYGSFGVPMAQPSGPLPKELPERVAAFAQRGLATGKQLIAPEVARTAILQPTQEKKTKQAQRAKELTQEATMHGKAAEILEPTALTSARLTDRLDKIRGQSPNPANSFKMGGITVDSDINVMNAFMSGDEEAKASALDTQRQVREVAGEFQQERENREGFIGGVQNNIEAVAGILPGIGKSAARSSIPVIGPFLSGSMWAKQGAGDIITTLKEQGVPDDVALAYGTAGGIAYAMVEQIQLGRVLSSAAKKAVGDSFKKKIMSIAKEKGLDALKNVREEVIQGVITEDAIISAMQEAGIDVDTKEANKRYLKTAKENFSGSLVPMTILSALGLAGGTARLAYDRKAEGPITEIRNEQTGEVTQIAGPKPLEAGKPEFGSLADFRMSIDEFRSLSEDEQRSIFSSLSPEGQQQILEQEPRSEGPLTQIVDEKTGETRPLGETPSEFNTLSGLGLTVEDFNNLSKEEQSDVLLSISPEERKQLLTQEAPAEQPPVPEQPPVLETEPVTKEAPVEEPPMPIEDIEQQAKEAIKPKPMEEERGLQRETETEIEKPQPIIEEPEQVSVAEKPVPAPKKEIIAKKPTEKKEKPSDKEDITGVPSKERVRKEPLETKPVKETGPKETPTGRILQAPEKINTPKGVTAEVADIPKSSNLNNEKVYEPVLNLQKKPTGWIRPKNNRSVLIDPENRKQVVFKAVKPEEATAKAKTNTAASGFAMKNPITTEAAKPVTEQVRKRLGIEPEMEEKVETTGKVSREAPVSPEPVTEGKVPAAKKEKPKKVAREKKPTKKEAPVTKRDKQTPKAETKPEEKPKFAKGKEAETFYSPLLKATQDMKQEKFTKDQLKNNPGVKKAEWDWIGMDEFFEGKKSVSKAEVERFVAENQVKVEDVQKGKKAVDIDWKEVRKGEVEGTVDGVDWYISEDTKGKYWIERNGVQSLDQSFDTFDDAKSEVENRAKSEDTKFSKWTLPGGKNYRERLITLPKAKDRITLLEDFRKKVRKRLGKKTFEYDDMTDEEIKEYNRIESTEEPEEFYYRSHFKEPNIIAHIRINDRIGPNDEKIYFIEESQSDWTREARSKGVRSKRSREELNKATKDYYEYVKSLRDKYGSPEETKKKQTEYEKQKYNDLLNKKNTLNKSVPPQPFFKNWLELSLKRTLRMAAEEGYDRVAWVTGKQTAERYNLSKNIDTIEWNIDTNGLVGYKNGIVVFDKIGIPENEIDQYIGKGPAERLLNQKTVYQNRKTIKGEDVNIGGEWAFDLYDDRFPKFFNKYGKKWGAKVEPVELSTGTQLSIPITEAMKKSVLEEGQPLFAKEEKGREAKPTTEKKITKAEKQLTDIVYKSVDKDPKYGSIQVLDYIDPNSEMGVVGNVVEKTTGKRVIFIKTDDRSLKSALGFTMDGMSLPGAKEGIFKDTIFVNVDSTRPLLWTAYHEFAHFLDANPEYNKRFWGAVKLTDKGKAELANEGKSELTADIIGEMMSRKDFWENLAKQNKTSVQKIMQEFIRIVNSIRNTVRKIMTSKETTEEQLPLYAEILVDVNAARDALAQIYSDYKKLSGKQVGDMPSKMTAVAKGEKPVFAKRKEEKKKVLPVREEPLNPFKKVEQFRPTDIEGVSKAALEAQAIFDKQKKDSKKKFDESIKERIRKVKPTIAGFVWDRVYLAKNMLGDSPAAQHVIGLINASKGASANAKMIYRNAVEKITQNLPYRLEETFTNYLQAKRTLEIEEVKGEGKVKHTGGMTKEQAAAWIDLVENKINKKDALAIKIAAGRYWNVLRGQLKELRDNGLISENFYQKLKEEGKHYSPRRFLKYIDPEKEVTGPKNRKISVRESGIQSLAEGSEEAMVNNWRFLLSDVLVRTQSRVFKNKASKALGDYVKSSPDNLFGGEIEKPLGKTLDVIDIEGRVDNYQRELLKLQQDLANETDGGKILDIENRIDDLVNSIELEDNRLQIAKDKDETKVFIPNKKQPKLPEGTERIYFMEDGESKAVLVPKDFADSWNQNDIQISHNLAQFLNFVSGGAVLRPFATGVFAPEFALTNIPRDMALQWLATHEYSKIAPVAVVQNLDNFRRVFSDAWHGKGRYEDYVKQGGGMDFLNEAGTFIRRDPTKSVTPLSNRTQKILDGLHQFQEFSERLTRLALREQAIKNGKSPEEATRIAREYLDFAQGGSLIKGLDNAIPYLNASVQGTRSVVESAAKDPKTFGIKAMQLIGMGIALALYATKYRGEEWDEISEREKVSRWNFPLRMPYKNKFGEIIHTYLSIPKDQSSRLLATIGETMVERFYSKTIDAETAWNRIVMALDDMSPIDAVGTLMPTASALIGYAFNFNFWKQDKVWKGREVEPYKEVYPGKTPKAYADLATGLKEIEIDLSPERLNQSIQQVMPKSLYTSLLGGTYEAVTAALSKEDQYKLNQTTYNHLSKMPLFRKYLRSTYPDKTDYQRLIEQADDYGISLTDEKGQKKTQVMVRNEIEKRVKELNNIRQEHDNEAMIISDMILMKEENDALIRWKKVKSEAEKAIVDYYSKTYSTEETLEKAKKEVDRIDKRISERVNRNKSNKMFKEVFK